MTKRTSKNALLTSILALFVCFTMLLSTTFAWFTDSVTSSNNVIKSGNLDIELEYYDGYNWVDVKNKSNVLTNELWEPGVTEVAYLRVANAGSLSFKYQLGINVVSETSGVNVYGEPFKLSDYVMFGVVENVNGETNAYANRADAVDAVINPKKISAGYGKASSMLPRDELYLALVVFMPTEVTNEANHNGVNVPEIDLGISVVATQFTAEEDSFDANYDKDASFAVTYSFNDANDLAKFSPTSDPAASGLRIEDGKAVVDSNGAWYTVETDFATNDYSTSYDLDITNLTDGESIVVDTGDASTWNSTPIYIERGSAKIYYGTHKNEYLGTLEGTELKITHTYAWNENSELVIKTVVTDGVDSITYEKAFPSTRNAEIYWDIYSVSESGAVTLDNFADSYAKTEIKNAMQLNALFQDAEEGGVVEMPASFNTTNNPITESIVIDKDVTINPNGMYLVSADTETFKVTEGATLTISDGSYTVKNTASNGAAILVDGGDFVMAGGSFDAHTAVKTVEGKSSTVTLAAGWSNRVTVGFDLNGDDTLNITGGTLISSQESIIADGEVTINMTGGTLSGKPARQNQYNPSVVLKDNVTFNMSGGKIETTANQSIAVCMYNNNKVNISGNAVIAGTNAAIRFGGFSREMGDNNEIDISGNARLTCNGAGNQWKIGFAVYVNATNTIVRVSDNAYIEGSSYGVITQGSGCEIYISGNVTIKAQSGTEGYGVGGEKIIMTGGTIIAKNYGLISDMANSVVTIDNSVSGSPISISGGSYDVFVHSTSTYTVGGNPEFDTFGTRA